jgi:hypothetical protein
VITMRIKDMFFDRARRHGGGRWAKRKVLSKAGAFIRTAAKTSIRKRKGSAPPGAPPHSHEGSLRRLILFGYDKPNDSVVVGPVGFKKSVAPNVLEYGGDTVVFSQARRQAHIAEGQDRAAAVHGPGAGEGAAQAAALVAELDQKG